MKESTPRSRYSVERQGSEDSRIPVMRKHSYRTRQGSGRSPISPSPGWNETQTRPSRKISDIYKNPQLYTGVWQNNFVQWSFPRICLYLVPTSVAFQFCAVFPAMLSAPNLILYDMPREITTLPTFFSGLLGACFIYMFRILVKKFYNHRRKLVCFVIGFFVYLTLGVLLVLLANAGALMTIPVSNVTLSIDKDVGNDSAPPIDRSDVSVTGSHVDIRFFSAPATNQMSSTLAEDAQIFPVDDTSGRVPMVTKILAFVGFAILATSVGSGQYLLQSVIMTSTHSDRHQHVVTIATLASASGGCFICILGTTDFSLEDNSNSQLLRSTILLSGVSIVLLVVGAACFFLAWRLDSRDMRRSIKNYSVAPTKTQRISRSPQEIFDECAHLLGHHTPAMPRSPYHSRPPKYYDPTQQRFVPRLPTSGSHGNYRPGPSRGGPEEIGGRDCRTERPSRASSSNLLDRQETMSTASERSELTVAFGDSTAAIVTSEILKRYNYASPQVKGNGNSRLRGLYSLFSSTSEMWKMGFVLALVFCLSSSELSFEYTATAYWSMVKETETPWDQSYLHTAIRKGSVGLCLVYAAFVLGLLLYCKFLDRVGWRKLTLALCLISSLLTLLVAIIRDAPGLFLPAALSHGLLKTMVVALPHLLTLQTVRSQGGHQTENRRQLLIETPTCVLWTLTPISLALSGVAAVPLAHVSGRVSAPMMYSAISGFLGCLGIIAIL